MIANVNCGLSQQLTGLLVNPLTRKLPLMSTDVNCGLSLQITCLLVNYPFMITTVNCDLSLQLTCLLVNLYTSQYFNLEITTNT